MAKSGNAGVLGGYMTKEESVDDTLFSKTKTLLYTVNTACGKAWLDDVVCCIGREHD